MHGGPKKKQWNVQKFVIMRNNSSVGYDDTGDCTGSEGCRRRY